MQTQGLGKLKWPLGILVCLVVPAMFWDDLISQIGVEVIDQTITVVRYALNISLWIAMAWLVIRLIDVLFWEALVAPRLGGHVPKLLKDVVVFVVFLIALTGILGGVFDLPISGLWAGT